MQRLKRKITTHNFKNTICALILKDDNENKTFFHIKKKTDNSFERRLIMENGQDEKRTEG